MTLAVHQRNGAVRFSVRVQTRSSFSGTSGVHAGALKVRLNAAPVDGAANEELVDVLAGWLDVPKRAITIISGAASRVKTIEVSGVTAEQLVQLAEGD
jgi:uncharacterized protein (TIGR00251 family)